MAQVIASIVCIGLCVLACVVYFRHLKTVESELKQTNEIQRQFMAAGLAYFVAMTKYVGGCTPLETVNYIDEE